MKPIYRFTQTTLGHHLIDSLMGSRALLFMGRKHDCPCCGWSLRTFTRGGSSWRARPAGYCPRCNSKPRHRWLWLHLQQAHPELFTHRLRLLHLSPAHSVGRSFRKLPNLVYTSGDLCYRSRIDTRFDVTLSPFGASTFDVIICIHVLEHVEEDRRALAELFRLLKPGGWALIAVPIMLEETTYEDPTIVNPADRQRLFGERDHVRRYGGDFATRLQGAGFTVQPFYVRDLDASLRQRCGLKLEEVMFFCKKSHAKGVET